MKLIYTHENRFFVNNAKNILENAGISTFLNNEYAAGAVGDLSPFDSWLELCLVDDCDYAVAKKIIHQYQQSCVVNNAENTSRDWRCEYCQEENDPSFDLCWSCQKEPVR